MPNRFDCARLTLAPLSAEESYSTTAHGQLLLLLTIPFALRHRPNFNFFESGDHPRAHTRRWRPEMRQRW